MKRSSGMKRGLAVSAIGALALSGLAVASAQAQTVAQGETALEFYSQTTDHISTANDGKNTSVTLFAGAPTQIDPDGGGPLPLTAVNAFRFQFEDGGVWNTIGTVNASDPTEVSGGIGTMQWTNPPGTDNSIDDLRVQALDINGNVLDTQNQDVFDENNNSVHESVSLDGALRSPIGMFENQVVVTGGSTDANNLDVANVGPEAADPTSPADITGPAVNGVFPWASRISIDPANRPVGETNEIIVSGEIAGESDDVNAYTLYDQVPTDVTVAVAPGDSANVSQPGNQSTTYILTVVDQNGAPVAGVDLQEVQPDGSNFNAGVGTDDNGDTDELGQFDTDLNEATMDLPFIDQNPAVGVQGTFYWADLNNNGTFENGPDKIVEITQTNIPQAPATIEIDSLLGNVMDADEDTDLTFTVKDANGDPVPNAGLNVTIDRDSENDANDSSTPFALVTDANGVATINGEQLGINNELVDVTINATAGAASASLDVETDEAVIAWDDFPVAQALATTDTTEGGVVMLPSGSVLPDRTVGLALDTPGANNALYAPQAEQPAGTTRGGDEIASAVSDANGAFAVKIDDPALPDGQELDNRVRATGNFAPTGFHLQPGDCPTPVPGLDPCTDLQVDFLRDLTPSRVEIHDDIGGTTADGLRPGIAGALAPGGLGIGEVVAFNADDVQLEDVEVNLTIDEGHFVKIDDAFENVAIGAPLDFKSAGQSLTVDTGEIVGAPGIGNAKGAFLANIERHEGFDDDGLVLDHINATAGAASDEHDMTWTTIGDPINPRATDPLVVELSDDQESSILPKARAGNVEDAVDAPPFDGDGDGQVVDYDVNTWDQFGNRTQQNTNEADNTPLADFVSTGQSDFDLNQPSISAFADSATNQSIEVELEGPVAITYTDDPEDSSFDPGNPLAFLTVDPVVVEDNTDTVNWYEADYDNSSFTLGQTGPETVPVGSVVTELLTAKDQEGQPLENLPVDFLRGGPGSEDDDTCNEDLLNLCQATNGNGQAFYDFVGGSAGTASVSAVVYTPEGVRIGTFGPDTVTFGKGRVAINAKLRGKNKRGKDVLLVRAPSSAEGAKVRLMRKFGNGPWKQAGPAKTLNALGNKSFKKRDRNGNRITKYRAKVHRTAETKGDWTNVVRLR